MSTTKRFPIRGGKSWSATFSDHPLDPFVKFDMSALTVADLAYHLSYVNRFCGAAGDANVAEHSVKLAWFAADGVGSKVHQCLVHDASEGLGCADAHGWLKKRLCPAIRDFEALLVDHVYQQFVGGHVDWSWIKPYDQRLGDWEAKVYGFPNDHQGDPLPPHVSPEHWTPERATMEFIRMWCATGGTL